jgi:hypothetical protein
MMDDSMVAELVCFLVANLEIRLVVQKVAPMVYSLVGMMVAGWEK